MPDDRIAGLMPRDDVPLHHRGIAAPSEVFGKRRVKSRVLVPHYLRCAGSAMCVCLCVRVRVRDAVRNHVSQYIRWQLTRNYASWRRSHCSCSSESPNRKDTGRVCVCDVDAREIKVKTHLIMNA